MPDLAAWKPEDWSAAAALGTFLVALIAAVVALVQYRSTQRYNRAAQESAAEQARLTDEANRQAAQSATEQSLLTVRLAEEEARPYVVVYMEPTRDGDAQTIDLVVRNFGKTAAHDVRVRIEPPPKRSFAKEGDIDRLVWLPDTFPTLVPGQEWRTLFDMGMQRIDSELPDLHRVVVEANDSSGSALPPMSSILDWGQYKGRMWTTVRTVHDAAEALREMEKHIKGWREGAAGGLRVFTRDGDAKDARTRAEMEARRAAQEALRDRVLPPDGAQGGDST